MSLRRLSTYLAPGRVNQHGTATEVFNEKEEEFSSAGSSPTPQSPVPQYHPQSGALAPVAHKDLYPVGDFRNATAEELLDIKSEVMVNWLYQQQMEMLWTAGNADEGIMLKKARGEYACCPSDIVDERNGFFEAIEALNVRVCMLTRFQMLDR